MATEGKSHDGVGRVSVYGHERALAALTGALASGRAPQALLLLGPASIGRSAVALRLAQHLFCRSVEGERPCGSCRACRLVAAGTHPDLLTTEVPLKVEAVREVQRRLALAPLEAGRHVALLPDIDRASVGAANCLLKTLEEPPADALLVLTASDRGSVLPTVLSRCQSLVLRPLPTAAMAALLVDRLALEPERADLLARLSGGRPGWAVRSAREPAFLESRGLWLDRMEEALAADRATRLRCADAWSRQRDALAGGLEVWLGWWRDVMLLQHGIDSAIVNVDRAAALASAARRYPVGAAVRMLRALESASSRLRGGANADLTAAVLLLELP